MKTTCSFCSEELTGPSHNCAGLNKTVFQEGYEPSESTDPVNEEEVVAPEETATSAGETTEPIAEPTSEEATDIATEEVKEPGETS